MCYRRRRGRQSINKKGKIGEGTLFLLFIIPDIGLFRNGFLRGNGAIIRVRAKVLNDSEKEVESVEAA